MHHFKYRIWVQVLIFFFLSHNLFAQDNSQIIGTSLNLNLEDGWTIDANSAMLSNKDVAIAFVEMAGVNFYDQLEDFKDIESDYATKGIKVKKNQKGKIGNYDAVLITLDSKPAIYQIFFGNKEFSVLANVSANDSLAIIDEEKIKTVLSSVEYINETTSAMEKHANFSFLEERKEWKFETYVANSFAFSKTDSDDAVLLMQLPPETLVLATKENLAKEFVSKYKAKMPQIEIIEEGKWQSKKLEGYKILLDVSKDGNENLGVIYMFIFNNPKSTFVFQGMGKKNDAKTIELFEDFINNLILKD